MDATAAPFVATYRRGPRYLVGEGPQLLAVDRGAYVARHEPGDLHQILLFRARDVTVVDGVLHHRGRPWRLGETRMIPTVTLDESFTGIRLPPGWTLEDHLAMVL